MVAGMEEDAENETKGTERLAEALQAHVWPTLHMKNSGGVGLPESLSSRPEQVEQSPHCPGPANTNALSEEGELLATGIDGEQDPGGESFEQLFAKFADMKGRWRQYVCTCCVCIGCIMQNMLSNCLMKRGKHMQKK